MLLSDPNFVEFLKTDVIPSWENVREPIKVAMDMGDGRKIHRTIGGNTVLYLVAPNGYVVDAFPGVYKPDDLLPILAESVGRSKLKSDAWAKYHESMASKRPENVAVNIGKMVVEAPVLEKLDVVKPPFAPTEGVVDMSHIPQSRDTVRQVVGATDEVSDLQAASVAVDMDSETNIRKLRPLVHELLSKGLQTPIDLKLPMFKDLLGVPIDDPNLGLTNVITPGGG